MTNHTLPHSTSRPDTRHDRHAPRGCAADRPDSPVSRPRTAYSLPITDQYDCATDAPQRPGNPADIGVPDIYPVAESLAGKPLLNERDLPGPLSLQCLSQQGAVARLDIRSGYQRSHSGTLYGRAMILSGIIPRNTAICAMSATWLWLGGTFPGTIDVLSRSHYRSSVHDRRIRVFNRKSPSEDLIRIGGMKVTTPARTICDLSLLPEMQDDSEPIDMLIVNMMSEYQVTPQTCLRILGENPFWPRITPARSVFEDMIRVQEVAPEAQEDA